MKNSLYLLMVILLKLVGLLDVNLMKITVPYQRLKAIDFVFIAFKEYQYFTFLERILFFFTSTCYSYFIGHSTCFIVTSVHVQSILHFHIFVYVQYFIISWQWLFDIKLLNDLQISYLDSLWKPKTKAGFPDSTDPWLRGGKSNQIWATHGLHMACQELEKGWKSSLVLLWKCIIWAELQRKHENIWCKCDTDKWCEP